MPADGSAPEINEAAQKKARLKQKMKLKLAAKKAASQYQGGPATTVLKVVGKVADSEEIGPAGEMPATDIPATDAPAAQMPATEEPTTQIPTTEVHTSEMPVTEIPTAETPATEEPTTQIPATEEPTTEITATEILTAEVPATQIPAAEITASEIPAAEEPTTDIPATEEPTSAPTTTPSFKGSSGKGADSKDLDDLCYGVDAITDGSSKRGAGLRKCQEVAAMLLKGHIAKLWVIWRQNCIMQVWSLNYPLYNAVSEGDLDATNGCISRGADALWINPSDKRGDTVLHLAAAQGNGKLINSLILAGAEVNAINVNDETPLHLAAKHGSRDSCQRLVSANADVDVRDNSRVTAKEVAVENGHESLNDILSMSFEPLINMDVMPHEWVFPTEVKISY